MTPQELFGVGLRLLAVVAMYLGFEHLLYFADVRLGWSVDPNTAIARSPNNYLIYASIYGLVGGIGLTFADSITKLLYGSENTPTEDSIDAS